MGKFTFIDLFAGIGGFRMALEKAGGKCLGFSEIAPDAIKAYCDNFRETPSNNFGDIRNIEALPEHDFLTAGVPCQSWSIAGKNLGFDDSRGQLWNDAIYLLNVSRPKAFIFENVKGLADPRNLEALDYIMKSIRHAGYHAEAYLLNAFDYGVMQNRIRIYIIGFRDRRYAERFALPRQEPTGMALAEIISGGGKPMRKVKRSVGRGAQSLSANASGMNDYFLFNDLRAGHTTVHTWDIIPTSDKEKQICNLLLRNRRKSCYGPLDGNPLSAEHFRELDPSVTESDLCGLTAKEILKPEGYLFRVDRSVADDPSVWSPLLCKHDLNAVNIDELKRDRLFRLEKINVVGLMQSLCSEGRARCIETRYDFKNTKISTGINGINRIFLPASRVYPTLVASDTNDFISEVQVAGTTHEEYKENFIDRVYKPGNYRKITREEACAIQGFPRGFMLPETRARWMKLIGNSVAVSLIEKLAAQVVATGVFEKGAEMGVKMPPSQYTLEFSDDREVAEPLFKLG